MSSINKEEFLPTHAQLVQASTINLGNNDWKPSLHKDV